ncbi:MAG TPA: hypothetical protein VN578_03935 [Candidatus Binatia bacterium]|jgi:hypothetical protein|nr:hypothetical protein [Candidatus Binatia bacterium]
MPIRINLLAEAQALEELRRRDPIKRAIWSGAALVFIILAWSTSLQVKAMMIKGELNKVDEQIAKQTNEYQVVLGHQRKLAEANRKLVSLYQVSTNRLLYGTLLNALQQTTLDDVQLIRFRAEQSYTFTDEVKARTNEDRVISGRPATVTERVLLTLDAKDNGANPGDQVNRYKQTLVEHPYFKTILTKTNEVRLASLSPPQVTDSKPFVLFTLECRYPEKTR